MFFNEDHLRITKVKTIDGTSPLIGPDERPVKKVIFAPDNPASRKLFEDQNTRLPTNLKMKIDPVKAYKPEPVTVAAPVDTSELENENASLRAELKKMKESQLANANSAKEETTIEGENDPDEVTEPEKKKMGRPKKSL